MPRWHQQSKSEGELTHHQTWTTRVTQKLQTGHIQSLVDIQYDGLEGDYPAHNEMWKTYRSWGVWSEIIPHFLSPERQEEGKSSSKWLL